MRHLGNTRADAIVHYRNVNSPGIGELLPDSRVRHVLIAGEHIGQYAHVTRSLHVILSANGTDADGRATKITG